MSFWGDWRGDRTPFARRRLVTLVRRNAFELVLGDEDATRLRPFVGRDDPAALEHVDEAAGPCVADAKPALEKRDAGSLGGDDDLDRLVEQWILVRIELAVFGVRLIHEHLRQLEERLVDLLLALDPRLLDDQGDLVLG